MFESHKPKIAYPAVLVSTKNTPPAIFPGTSVISVEPMLPPSKVPFVTSLIRFKPEENHAVRIATRNLKAKVISFTSQMLRS